MRILDKNRANYKRTFSQKRKCIFCNTKNDLVCRGLSGNYWLVIVNKYPYMDGNLMIVPSRHIEKLEKLTQKEWQEFSQILIKTQTTLTKIFKTKSFNIAINIGKESGASIPHIHWQVVPRKFKNATVMNTFADLHIVGTTPEETHELINKTLK